MNDPQHNTKVLEKEVRDVIADDLLTLSNGELPIRNSRNMQRTAMASDSLQYTSSYKMKRKWRKTAE